MTGFYSGIVNGAELQELFDFIEAHKVNAAPEKIFHLSEIRAAQAYLEDAKSFGKVVVIND